MANAANINWFGRLESREEALAMCKSAGIGLLFIAALQGAIGVFLLNMPSMLVDALVFAVTGTLIWKLRSRAAAVVACAASLLTLVSTVGVKLGLSEGGGNVFLAAILTWATIRSLEATFKLAGRFKDATVA